MAGRQPNETAAQLEIEETARKAIEAKWGVEVIKLQPHVYGVDWAIIKRDALHSWGEFKRRHHDFGQYRSLDISLGKWLKLKWNAERSLRPFAIYVEWDDGLYWQSWSYLTPLTYPLGVLRRTDRGQDGDIEPSIKIPVMEFKKL